jgi:hypothetical protein
VETYAHAFFTGIIARRGFKAGAGATAAATAGSMLPDMPSFAGVAYYVGLPFLWEGWSAMHGPGEAVEDAIYVTGPFGATGSALHSVVPALALLLLYRPLRVGRVDGRGVLLWFLIGWAGHAVADFLTHATDARPLLWPISDWTWQSPVSYWNPAYYGNQFFLIEHALILATLLYLVVHGLASRRGGSSSRPPR